MTTPSAEETYQDLRERWDWIENRSLYYRPDKTLRYLETYPKTVAEQVASWEKFRRDWEDGKKQPTELQSQAANLNYVQMSIDEANRRILGSNPQAAACLAARMPARKTVSGPEPLRAKETVSLSSWTEKDHPFPKIGSLYDDPKVAKECGIWWRPPGKPKSVDVVGSDETLVLFDAIDHYAPSVQSIADELSRAVGEEISKGGSRAGAAAAKSFWNSLSPLAKAAVVGVTGVTALGLVGFSLAQIRVLLPPSRR